MLPHPNPIVRSLHIALHDTRGISGHERACRHVTRDETRCPDDAIISNRHTREYNGVRADETIVADMHVAVDTVDKVVRENGSPEAHNRIFANVDSPRISLVEIGAKRNTGALANVHLPDPNEALATELLRRELMPLYLYYLDDHIARLTELKEPALATAFVRWRDAITPPEGA